MYHLKDIGQQVLLRHRQHGGYFVAVIIDVKKSGYIVEVEESAKSLVGFPDMLVDLGHDKHSWQLWEKMF